MEPCSTSYSEVLGILHHFVMEPRPKGKSLGTDYTTIKNICKTNLCLTIVHITVIMIFGVFYNWFLGVFYAERTAESDTDQCGLQLL